MSLIDSLARFMPASLKQAFVENLGLKVLSLTFALGLFGYLHGQEDQQQRTVPVGVVLRLPPEAAKRDLMTPIPASIHVTLRGSMRSIDSLLQAGIAPVEIDLSRGSKDQIVFEPDMFTLPPGMQIAIIDPPNIDLEWQDVVTRKIPVQAAITGKPAEGFVVKGEPEVDPKELEASGPVSLVEVMQFARLSAFDVSGLTEGVYRRRLAIDAPPSRVSYVGPHSATVTVTILRRTSEAKFARRPVEVTGVPNGITTPHAVDVTVIGPPEVVRALRADQVVPTVDLSKVPGIDLANQKHGSALVPVRVDIADADAEIQPPSVTVKW
ncbi:MAG: CdaR family protein [Sorangiineae bacterium]|nr:CdaR family protein [Sorangiineae bacterium]